jgi:hypothetical protein
MTKCQKCQLNDSYNKDPLVIIKNNNNNNNNNITNTFCLNCIKEISCKQCKLNPYNPHETYYYMYNNFYCEKCFHIKFYLI